MADPVKRRGQQRSENCGTCFPILPTLRIKSMPALPRTQECQDRVDFCELTDPCSNFS